MWSGSTLAIQPSYQSVSLNLCPASSCSHNSKLLLVVIVYVSHQCSAHRGDICDSQHVHACVYVQKQYHLDYITDSVWHEWWCLNQCPGWHIPARALHAAPAHQVKSFWFLKALSLPVSLFARHLGVCRFPSHPLYYTLFTSGTSPAFRTHRWHTCDLRLPWYHEKSNVKSHTPFEKDTQHGEKVTETKTGSKDSL